jgi:hypothetical protein
MIINPITSASILEMNARYGKLYLMPVPRTLTSLAKPEQKQERQHIV